MSFSHDSPAACSNALARRTALSASESLGLSVRLRILRKRDLSSIGIATEASIRVLVGHLSRLVELLLSEVKAKNWRRDTRLAIINRRILSIWNWLLGAAGCAMVAAVNWASVAAIEVMPARAIDMQGVAIAGRVRDVG